MGRSIVVPFRSVLIRRPCPAKAHVHDNVRVSVARSIQELPSLGRQNPKAALLAGKLIHQWNHPPSDGGLEHDVEARHEHAADRGLTLPYRYSGVQSERLPAVATFHMNASLKLCAASPALLQLLGVSSDRLHGDAWESLVDGPDELRAIRNHWLIAAQLRQGFETHLRCVQITTGGVLRTRLRVTPRHDGPAWLGFLGHVQLLAPLTPPVARTA